MGVPCCGRTVPAGTENPGDHPAARLTAWTRAGRVVALLTHANVSNDIEGIVMEATTNVAAATGKPFRYDGGEYIYYNWSTKARTQGTYSNARRPR